MKADSFTVAYDECMGVASVYFTDFVFCYIAFK